MFKLVVLVSCMAFAAGKPGLIAPGLYSPLGFSNLAYSTPLVAGPLSLAPGQPANILGADGRPLDTLDVNIAKAQHFNAKLYDGTGIHLLKKRSVAPLAFASPLISQRIVAPAPLTYGAIHAPLAYAHPLAYSGYAPSTLVHAW